MNFMPRDITQRSFFLILFTGLCVALSGATDAQAAEALPCLNAPAKSSTSGQIIRVSNDSELQQAVANLVDNTTILLNPGQYNLSKTLYIRKANITIEGPAGTCDQATLAGKGMDNSSYGEVAHGIWTDAPNLTVRNLTIKNVYYHSIAINRGAESPIIYNVRMLDSGEQFIKASSAADGNFVDDGTVAYSIMQYTSGPPKTDHGGGVGYTNGVDVHGGQRWIIRNNVFKDFHTPDGSANQWNPAILMWRGAKHTLSENNIFINCDRAIAYGLGQYSETVYSHEGGIIRNNMIYNAPGLFSSARKLDSDGAIIIWDSPGTKIYHNTALTSGNLNKFVEFRFRTSGSIANNNLGDAPIAARSGAVFSASNNSSASTAELFANPASGNLRLKESAASSLASVPYLSEAATDIDGESRNVPKVHPGADQFNGISPPSPPSDVKGVGL